MKRLLLLTIAVFALAPGAAQAASCTSNVTGSFGNWEDASTWSNCGGVAPTSADSVTIDGSDIVLMNDVTGTQTVTSLTINSGLLQATNVILNSPTVTLAGGQLSL